MEFFGIELTALVAALGLVGIAFVIFAESGLFFGFFLPGDSLLFTAGFLASQGFLEIRTLIVLTAISAIAGDSVGYFTGKHFQKWLRKKPDSLLFKKKYLKQAEAYYKNHGGKTLILARFIPGVRTFAPIVAGMARMNYKKFLSFNVMGGIIWGVGVPLAGFFLGSKVPGVDSYIIPIVVIIIIISLLPSISHTYKKLAFPMLVVVFAISGILAGQRQAQPPSQQQVLSGGGTTIDIVAHRVIGDSEFASIRDEDDITKTLLKAESIWAQAGIDFDFKLKQTELEQVTMEGLRAGRLDTIYFDNSFESGKINVFFVGRLPANGVAVSPAAAFVNDVTTVNDYRATAHEIGHLLGLAHTSASRSRLMFQSANGEIISEAEARAVLNFLGL